jgi:hypothetical protein
VGVRSDESRRVVVFPKSKGRSEGKNSFWRFRSSSFHLSQILELPISRRTAITRATRPNSVLLVSTSPNRPYEGLEGAAEGSGPPETVLVVLDALVVAVDLVAEPGDAVPMDGSENADDGEGTESGVYTTAERGPRSTTATATEIPEAARMKMRMTNQWRRQKEGERVCLRCGGTRSEVEECGLDRT